MARVKKKKPLRGSVRQNNTSESLHEGWTRWFGFWPRLALLVLGCIAMIMLAGWLWHGERPRAWRAEIYKGTLTVSRKAGFSVKDVIVTGRHYTDKETLLDALGVRSGDAIYAFGPQQAHERIMALPWVKSASILRSLPNKIFIELVEKKPLAQWQHDNKKIIIDEEGEELAAASPEQFPSLPLIVGDVEPAQIKELLSLMAEFPQVSTGLKAAVRVAMRRWNLLLEPDITIRLPEKNAYQAMERLTTLIKDQKIIERNVKAVDLRLPEKIYIEPREDGEKEK